MTGDGLDPMHPDVEYPTCPRCGQPMDDDWCGCIWRDFWTDLYAAVRETYAHHREDTTMPKQETPTPDPDAVCGHRFPDGTTCALDRALHDGTPSLREVHGEPVPRPAAVSEEATRIIANLRQMIDESNDARYGTLSTAVVSSALDALTAALPHLAPGQSEAEVRADERAKAAERITVSIPYGFGMRHDGTEDPLSSAYAEGIHVAADIARTAPAEDGAQ